MKFKMSRDFSSFYISIISSKLSRSEYVNPLSEREADYYEWYKENLPIIEKCKYHNCETNDKSKCICPKYVEKGLSNEQKDFTLEVDAQKELPKVNSLSDLINLINK